MLNLTTLKQTEFDHRRALYGPAGRLYLFCPRQQTGGGLESLLPQGLRGGWQLRVKRDPQTGEEKQVIEILMLSPITEEMCRRVTRFQTGKMIFEKTAQTPDDGTEPRVWLFQVSLQQGQKQVS